VLRKVGADGTATKVGLFVNGPFFSAHFVVRKAIFEILELARPQPRHSKREAY
jgi:hypothetical protein